MAMRKIEKTAPIILGVILAGGITFLKLNADAKDDLAEANVKTNVSVEQEVKQTAKQTAKEVVEEEVVVEREAKEIVVPKKVVKERKNLNNFLFIGDSFTYLMKDTIASNNDNVYIHAKSGSRPSYWIDRVADMPENDAVEGIVLLIGVNGASTDENKKDVITLMNKISEKYPDKKVYVQKIFPVGVNFHAKGFNEKIDVLNEIIENHVNTLDNFARIDTTTDLVDENGYLKHADAEGLHIQSSYNDVFYRNILKAVQEAEKNM